MAILKNGLWGGITGKLGNTVCYVLNGQQVVRMIVKSDKKPTQKQLDNWANMQIVNDFLKPVKAVIQQGFELEAKRRRAQPYNIALGYIKKHALKGEAPDREIDYPKVMLSIGDLPLPEELELELSENALMLRWSPVCEGLGRGSDRVIVLAYCPAVDNHPALAFFELCGAARGLGQDVLVLPAQQSGRPLEIYVFVRAADGKALSNSQYLGRLD